MFVYLPCQINGFFHRAISFELMYVLIHIIDINDILGFSSF